MASTEGIRRQYELHGVQGFYERDGASYRNPHEKGVQAALKLCVSRWALSLQRTLDLACGSGEVTLALLELGCHEVEGIDPFTGDAYYRRTGRRAKELSFEEIAEGALAEEHFSLIVCSYALHLCAESRLPGLLVQLGLIAPDLIVVTPHKRPEIRRDWGWQLEDELVADRVRARLYHSFLFDAEGAIGRREWGGQCGDARA